MDEIARLTPQFHGVSYAKLDKLGSLQWPCNGEAPEGTPLMHVDRFVRGKGLFQVTEYVPTTERTSRRYPLILTTGRILSQYNVGAQTRRTANTVWHPEDRLAIHPHDAEQRGIRDGGWVGVTSRAQDFLAEEVPVSLVYNGKPHVVMLATPLDLEDFALGFSLCEGLLHSPDELRGCRVYSHADGLEVRLRVAEERAAAFHGRERNLAGRTGCGLCGAAAWVEPGRGIVNVREDVGRHNALDKLIGTLARTRTDFSAGLALVTSRASFEMVQKCACVGITTLAAISAPTALAVRLAEETGLTLIGFARDTKHVVYSHRWRLSH